MPGRPRTTLAGAFVYGELQTTLRSEVRIVHYSKSSSENDRARYNF